MIMKALIGFAALLFATSAFAQSAQPKVGNKPLVQVKPKAPMGCKLIGTVKGTKLWAGDCAPTEPNSAALEPPAPAPLAAQAAGAITPDPKQ
jgi:hypothetical protein